MKTTRNILLSLLAIVCVFSFTACKESLPISNTQYLQDTVVYKLNGSDTSKNLTLADVSGDSCPLNSYKVIQINTKRAWTYGLTITKITFDVILSQSQNVAIDLTISNLKNGANYNETADTYFYKKTITIAKENTPVTLEINDEFIDKDATFSFEIDTSCYKTTPSLKIAIQNFKIYGEHQKTTY